MEGYLTTKEAADRLGVSAARIRKMILDGLIQGVEKFGRENVIPDAEIIRLEKLERRAGRPRIESPNKETLAKRKSRGKA